jgi:hypothetical protein
MTKQVTVEAVQKMVAKWGFALTISPEQFAIALAIATARGSATPAKVADIIVTI